VENSSDLIARYGLALRVGGWLSATVEASSVSESFSDAANTLFRADGQQGIIPAYTIADFSFEARVTDFLRVEGSVNNLADARSFTARATAYPGPGILPGMAAASRPGSGWSCDL
jgi:Fe(3+) dicitrate transport protein